MNITPNNKLVNRDCQKGQSSVFVIVFIGITLLSLVFLYKAGKLTSEKMELQNAADGVAYSVAVLEARDLNFMAYTNRAMVANEVAIGQAVGLSSWARHWESIGYYEHALCGTRFEPIGRGLQLLAAIPFVGSALNRIGTEMINQCNQGRFSIRSKSTRDFTNPGQSMWTNVNRDIAVPLAQLIESANRGLSDAQSIFHLGTLAYVARIVGQVSQDNMTDNNPGDTRLSPYGLAALLGHLYSFGHMAPYINSYGPDPNRNTKPYIRTYQPASNATADRTGFERFAAITNASRDEFGKGPRRWGVNPIFAQPVTVNLPINFGIFQLRFFFEFTKGLSTPIDHRAGSDLRYANDSSGNQFNWSSGDTNSGTIAYTFRVRLEIGVRFCLPVVGCTPWVTAGAFGEVIIGGRGLQFSIGITLPFIGTIPIPPITIPLGLPGLPMGAGAAQINASNTNKLFSNDIDGIPNSDQYGHAPSGSSVAPVDKPAHAYAWDGSNSAIWFPARTVGSNFRCPRAPGPVPQPNCRLPSVEEWMPNSEVQNNLYTGLKQYSDTTSANDLWGFEGPNIIIGLEKQITDIYTPTAPQPAGQFQLNESANANNVVSAIAKGEVYFKRPSDVDLFRRWDTSKDGSGRSATMYEEFGSAFNPYWQARLAPTSHADRAVAVSQQHGQDMETGNATARTITSSWDPDTWIR